MLQWIETCLVPYLEEKPADTPSFLLLDPFSVHLTRDATWTGVNPNRGYEYFHSCVRVLFYVRTYDTCPMDSMDYRIGITPKDKR
jgi:hypothetical protein